jgi:hypothetical protein
MTGIGKNRREAGTNPLCWLTIQGRHGKTS